MDQIVLQAWRWVLHILLLSVIVSSTLLVGIGLYKDTFAREVNDPKSVLNTVYSVAILLSIGGYIFAFLIHLVNSNPYDRLVAAYLGTATFCLDAVLLFLYFNPLLKLGRLIKRSFYTRTIKE